MAFRFRKSFSIGLFRINISKSGIGYSFGFPGYRITKTANSRKRETISIPGTGISFVSEHSQKIQKCHIKDIENNLNQSQGKNVVGSMFEDKDIGADSDLLKKLKILKFARKFFIMYIFMIHAGIYYLFNQNFGNLIRYFWIIDAIVIVGILSLKVRYTIRSSAEEYYNKLIDVFENLKNSKSIEIQFDKFYLREKKHFGEATYGAKTIDAKIKISKRSYLLKTDIKHISVTYGKERITILPNEIIFFGKDIKADRINKGSYSIDESLFVIFGKIPKDTEVERYTWEHVNKNGTPDMRYKSNRQLPICKFISLKINVKDVHWAIVFSNFRLYDEIERKLKAL